MANQTGILEAMSFTQLIDKTFRVYGRSFVRIMIIGVAAMVPLYFAGSFVAPSDPLQLAADPSSAIGSSLIFTGIVLVVLNIQMSAIVAVVSDKFLNQGQSLGKLVTSVLPRVPNLIFATFLYAIGLMIIMLIWFMIASVIAAAVGVGIAGAGAAAGQATAGQAGGVMGMLGGSILGILATLAIYMVPILFMAIPMLLFPSTATIEKKGALAIMSRSWDLMKGIRIKSFVTILVFIIIHYAIIFAVFMLMGIEGKTAADLETMISLMGLVNLVMGPLYYVVGVLLYYDSRIRKENFGLELLAQDLGIGDAGQETAN